MEWNDRFMMLFREGVERYLQNTRIPADRFFLPEELEFLATIGYQAAEMHGYIQDYAVMGEPSPSTTLLIAAMRRSYFIASQRGITGNAKPVKASDLPSEAEEFQEIPYLPHIIRKAEAKMYGTLDPTLMYGNEKDRRFLKEHGNIHPADFLYWVWSARGDRQKMVSAVLNAMRAAAPAGQPGDTAPAETAPAAPAEPAQTELTLD